VPASTAAKPASASSSAQSSGTPRSGGTLKIGRVGDLSGLEPMRVNPGSYSMIFPLYDRLTEYDDKLQPQPRLAESWDISSDGKQISCICARACSSQSAAARRYR
jgi:peptide/nickel transport system substrate-binding protein